MDAMVCTCLSHDDVLRLEESAHSRPEPVVRDDLIVFLGDNSLKLGDFDFVCARLERLEARGEFRQEVLHADAREHPVLDFRVVGVELE